ncbi:non-ribosomal peptide synthetase [Prescottella defluvii]|uniref:non-ribosomal peptide synthetase n=1 Tax=Prescottella defluvii TaxID=1323361 RepID=UPI000689DDD8|nr:non-ribosomal peptide synthetase [Prescottella defluvii]
MTARFPLSAAQLGVWYAQQLDPETPCVMAHYVEVRGSLDVEMLARATDRASRELQSPVLRLCEVDGEPRQFVHHDLEDGLSVVDLSSAADPVQAAHTWMDRDRSRPLDMVTDRVIAATAIRLGPEHFYWYGKVHHVALDGFGATTLMNRIAQLYTLEARGETVPASTASGLEVIHDLEQEYPRSRRFVIDEEYWGLRLASLPDPVSLSAKSFRPRPSAVPLVASSRVRAVQPRDGSVAPVVIAAWACYLARMTGCDDIVLSLPVSARTTAKMRRSGAMIANIVPVRVRIEPGATVDEVVSQVSVELTGALRHQRYRFDGSAGSMLRSFGPVVNLMLFRREIELADAVGEFHVLSTGPVEDLSLNVYDGVPGAAVRVDLEANPALYTRSELVRHHERFATLLELFETVPGATAVEDLLVGAAGDPVRVDGSVAEAPRPLARLLLDGARLRPGAVAVESGSVTLTYGELDARSARLARVLADRGAEPETSVVLALPRSIDLIVAMWAVARSGAAFVPVDPELPAERLHSIVVDSGAVLGLTVRSVVVPAGPEWILLDDAVGDRPGTVPVPLAGSDDLRGAEVRVDNAAYMIYTSGTTGRPKGVTVTHRGLASLAAEVRCRYRGSARARVLHSASPGFDAAVQEWLLAFTSGATLVLLPAGVIGGPELGDFLREHTVSHFISSPAVLSVTDPSGLDALEVVDAGGDRLPAGLADVWADGRLMLNAYGPTETTVLATLSQPLRPGSPAPIGTPVRGTAVVVLDRRLHAVSVDAVGELYIGGVGLARGYHGLPGATAARFVADPHGAPGSRLYRTGDLVRWTELGELEFVGRADTQIQIRGFRVELGEIEAVFERHAAVVLAVAVAGRGPDGESVIAVHILPANPDVFEVDAVRRHAAAALPYYMVPNRIHVLTDVPATVNGKVDRRALPSPSGASAEAGSEPARTRTEEAVAEVFADVLRVGPVGRDDDFFASGGHSLAATRVGSRLTAVSGIELGVRDIFDNPTVRALAAHIDAAADGPRAIRPPLEVGMRPDVLPLSAAQLRMWFLARLDPESSAYLVPMALRVRGGVDLDALRAAFADVATRHEVLRTVYPETVTGPVQELVAVERAVPDLCPVDITGDELDAALRDRAAFTLDVRTQPPLRTVLYRLAPDEHVLVIGVHHIAADGWSVAPMTDDLLVAYRARVDGAAPQWDSPVIQYADYALWQHSMLGRVDDPASVRGRQLDYWRGVLSGAPARPGLPFDRPRPTQPTGAGASVRATVGFETVSQLQALASGNDSSLFMVVHAAFAALLSRVSDEDDIVVGAPVAGRGAAELDRAVGMFVATVPLRTTIDPDEPFVDVVMRARRVGLDAFAHTDLPFEDLVDDLAPERVPGEHPVFQVALAFQNQSRPSVAVPGLDVEVLEVPTTATRFDLELAVDPVATGEMALTFTYATELFELRTMRALADAMLRILATVAADPTVRVRDIDLGAETPGPVSDCADRTMREAQSLTALFDDRVRQAPDSAAIVAGDDRLTYRDLDLCSNALARRLVAAGAGPDRLVAVAMPRGIEMVVTLLAVLKTGSAYVPLDLDHPAERLRFVLDDARPVAVVTTLDLSGRLAAGPVPEVLIDATARDTRPLSRRPRPDEAAYVLYTSGTTGHPKAVVVSHGNVTALLDAAGGRIGAGPTDVWTMFHSYAFDFAVWEMWGALAHGGTLVVVDPFVARSPEDFRALLERERVTILDQTPTAFHELIRTTPTLPASVRWVIFGGEASDIPRLRSWWRSAGPTRPRLANMYGITETTVHATFHDLDAEMAEVAEMAEIALPPAGVGSPIGRPLPGLDLVILDVRLRPVLPGVTGEIYVRGAQLARGYLRRPGATMSRFVADPWGSPGDRMYRTGDVARRRSDGAVDFVGRIDDQVKIRGVRIELGEVESVLRRRPEVGEAAAIVRRTDSGGEIVGYVSAAANHRADPGSILRELRTEVPAYLVPAELVVLDRMPVTVNGKLDRKALPAPVARQHPAQTARSAVEQQVAEVFADLLGGVAPGPDESLFEVGGNSLIAARAAARLGALTGRRVEVRDVFEHPTVAGLTRLLDRDGIAWPAPSSGPRPDRIPLSPAQHRLWLVNRMSPDSGAYNLPIALRLGAGTDVEALRLAVADVIARHEALRTIHPVDDAGPYQSVVPVEDARVGLAVHVTDDPVAAAAVVAGGGFDLTTQLPFRAVLFENRFRRGDDVLALVVHHIAADGWSLRVLAHDLAAAYGARAAGRAPSLPLPAVQYPDFSLWQHRILEGDGTGTSLAAEQLAYWTRTLDGLPEEVTFPTDRARPATASGAGATVAFGLDADLYARVAAVARAHDATVFMVLHAALALLLSRFGAGPDVAIGTPVAGRGHGDLDDVVGMFAGTLVLRVRLDPDGGFTQLLDGVRSTDAEAFSRSDIPFDRLVEEVGYPRSLARHPLFQVALSMEDRVVPGVPGLAMIDELDLPTFAKFDLQLTVTPDPESGAECRMDYATDLYDERSVRGFADAFVRVLTAVTADPAAPIGGLDLLGPTEPDVLRGRHAVPRRSLGEILEAAVSANPDGVAVCDGADALTYRQLDRLANRLARLLRERGWGTEDVVAVALSRSLESVVSVWACAKAGVVFAPVDPAAPPARNARLLADAGAVGGITVGRHLHALPELDEWICLDDAGVRIRLDELPAAALGDAGARNGLDCGAYLVFTSGSTGTPKGVLVTHRGLATFAEEQRERYTVDTDSRVLHFAPTTFDGALLEILLAAPAGATLVVAPTELYGGPDLAAFLRREGVTHAFVTTAAWTSIGVDPRTLPDLRTLIVGGEALPAGVVRNWASGRRMFNAYGPTETTIVSMISDPLTPDGPITIGGPIRGVGALVLDTRLRPVPVGAIGELYLAGNPLARGYHGRAAATAASFVAHPRDAGVRMYRTGDLVRRSADGIVFVGRGDRQIKLRGHRIDPAEVDAVLTGHAGIESAATVARPGPGGEAILVSYIATPSDIDIDDVRTMLRRTLPAPIVPTTVTPMDSLPLTVNGKIDYAALPTPVLDSGAGREPAGQWEIAVAGAFTEVLGMRIEGVDTDFFRSGGSSLGATRLVGRLRNELHVHVSVRDVFEYPTVAALAVRLAEAPRENSVVPARTRPDVVPLSPPQQRLWLLDRLDPGSAVYNIAFGLRMRGRLDVDALERAIGDVYTRHEILRTSYPGDAHGPRQHLHRPGPVELRVLAVPADEFEARAGVLAADGFDLAVAPPVRTVLLSALDEDHLLVVVVHHIAFDGWSLAPLAGDVARAYAARLVDEAPRWDDAPTQYADYTLQRITLLGAIEESDSTAAREREHWREVLRGLPALSTVPTDRPRPDRPSFRGGLRRTHLTPDRHRALLDLAHEHGVSLFMVVHAALAVVLARLGSSRDIAIGTSVSGRGEPELDTAVGMFVNTLVLRTRIDPAMSLSRLLAEVRACDLAALEHSMLPFEQVVESTDPPRVEGAHPLFQVFLAFGNLPSATAALDEVAVDVVDLTPEAARFDLEFSVTENLDHRERPAGLAVALGYSTDLFDESTAVGLVETLDRVLGAFVSDPHRAVGDIALPGEIARTSGEGAPDTVLLPEVFSSGAAVGRHAAALRADGWERSYGQLDSVSNRLARELIRLGVGPETVVALAFGRSPEWVTAMLAVSKAGGAFVTIDPEYPPARIAYLLADSAATVVVADVLPDEPLGAAAWVTLDALVETSTSTSAAPVTDVDRIRPLRAEHPAYVVYTSGSTGRPKGVVVTHVGLSALTALAVTHYGVGPESVVLQNYSANFDAALLEVILALGAGATLVFAPPGRFGGTALTRLLREERVTHLLSTPSALATVDPTGLPRLETVAVGGELCPPELVQQWAAGDTRSMVNAYGPTEATVVATAALVRRGRAVDIGAPVPGTSVMILDGRLRPVPRGVVGELYLAGAGLARGYLGDLAATASRFVADPYGGYGTRMYRTGDRVRWNARGGLEYIGRTDSQLKVRGYRVEPGEIDSILVGHSGIALARTVLERDVLVSYVAARTGESPDPDEIRKFAAAALPAHLVPSRVEVLDEIPLTGNGKLDVSALPGTRQGPERWAAAGDSLQQTIVEAFADVLALSAVGVDDDFFALGGSSLSATSAVARIEAASAHRIAVRDLFDNPTARGLATALRDRGGASPRPFPRAGRRGERIPLAPQQRRLWLVNRLDSESTEYNIRFGLRVRGGLDRAALDLAVADVMERHDTLRTIHPDSADGPHQVVLAPFSVPITDHDAVPDPRAFDLTTEMPLRIAVVPESAGVDLLVVELHHIAADGWSMGPFGRDLVDAYRTRVAGHAPSWTPPTLRYRDYSAWSADMLGSEDDPDSVVARCLDYWIRTLERLPDRLPLPFDRQRPGPPSHRGAAVRREFDTGTASLMDAARAHGASQFMVVHAVWAAVLARYAGVGDIAVATPTAGRGPRELDDMVGMFVGTTVLRTDVDTGASFAELLATVRDTDLGAFAHSDVPFDRLVETIRPRRVTTHHPLVQVMLTFGAGNAADRRVLSDNAIEPVELASDAIRFDLELDVTQGETGLDVRLDYATDVFTAGTADRLVDAFGRMLDAVLADPTVAIGDVDLGGTPITGGPSQGATDPAEATLPAILRAAAAVHHDRVALRCNGVDLSYGDLDEWSDRVAGHLSTRGAGPETVVALAFDRSVEFVVAMWAVAKTGAAFLSVDPRHPAARIALMLADSGAIAGLTTSLHADGLPHEPGWILLDRDLPPAVRSLTRAPRTHLDQTAYVIYTSGTSGVPKGTAVTHRGLLNLVAEQRERYRLTPTSRVLQVASPSFDASVFELIMAAANGATSVIAGPNEFGGAGLHRLLVEEKVTHAVVTPAVLATLDPHGLDRLGVLISAGDICPPEQARRWTPGRRFFNAYGPSEVTIMATGTGPLAELEPGSPVPIGAPIAGVRADVLDDRLRPTPPGAVGDLYLAGPGLARGYPGRPPLTASRFVADPRSIDGGRLYRTGDRVRVGDNGELHFVGRSDDQVQVAGARVELPEIDAALGASRFVATSVTLLRDARLVAYVVLTDDADGSDVAGDLRRQLSLRLPRNLIPGVFVPVDEIPLSINGKVDRAALADLPLPTAAAAAPPCTATERVVASVFEEVLGGGPVGRDTGFFDAGGTSLGALQVVTLLSRQLDRRVPVSLMFPDATPARLAESIENSSLPTSGALGKVLPLQTNGTRAPLFCVHPAAGVAWSYAGLVQYLGGEQSVYGLQAPGLEDGLRFPGEIADLAADYVREIRRIQPHGPYHLAGWSLGGVIAHAIATELQDQGEPVALLVALDSLLEVDEHTAGEDTDSGGHDVIDLLAELEPSLDLTGEPQDLGPERATELLRRADSPFSFLTAASISAMHENSLLAGTLVRRHRPSVFTGDLVFFTAAKDRREGIAAPRQWDAYVTGKVREVPVDCTHAEMTAPTALAVIGPILAAELRARDPRGHCRPEVS